MADLAASTHLHFAPHIDTSFELTSTEASRSLTLVAVDARTGGQTAAGREPFSLVFRGEDGVEGLPQGLYHLEHEGLGDLDLFLVPIGPEGGAMQYEAVFN
jgi:hypothetical protein